MKMFFTGVPEKYSELASEHHFTFWVKFGAIAQLGERLPCKQEVRSSILLGSTIYFINLILENWIYETKFAF